MARRHTLAEKVGGVLAAIGGTLFGSWAVRAAFAETGQDFPFRSPLPLAGLALLLAAIVLIAVSVRGVAATRPNLTKKQRALVTQALASGTAEMNTLADELRRDMPDSDLRDWGVFVFAGHYNDIAKWREYATALLVRISPEHGALFGDLAGLASHMPADIQARVERMEPVSRQRVTQLWDDLDRRLQRLREFLA